jgi:hypothetical protein
LIIAVVESLKALDPDRPIREADIVLRGESRLDGCMGDGVCTPDCIADQSF